MVLKNQIKSEALKERDYVFGYQIEKFIDSLIADNIFLNADFISQIQSFITRNALVKLNEIPGKHRLCCKRCLKAHMLEIAKTMCSSQDNLNLINEIMECETGHYGYYLDGKELKKIEELKAKNIDEC